MPPKRGQKRKASGSANGRLANGDDALTLPDRNTWPGWVEMESEPAFFNVMLKDMGVRGVKVHEVYSIEDDMLAALPQPVHALIFLFRYHTEDEANQETGVQQDDIWFANQVPDFACASVALLNIVNNIPSLQMGQDLRNFKAFTNDMDPLSRGDAIDSFDFVKRIHNSFARENDLLQADSHLQEKLNKWKKKQAAAKARATKAAKKAAEDAASEEALKERSANVAAARSARASTRAKKGAVTPSSISSTPKSKPTYSVESSPEPNDGDDDFEDAKKTKAEPATEPTKPAPRRSGRAPKPRKKEVYESEAADEPSEGFHFIAYMPINGHVWKLDGLDYFPHDMGSFGLGGNGADGGTGNWMHVVAPAIQGRMMQFEGAEIEFNLMAVVHDPSVDDRNELLQNIKIIQAIDTKLDVLYDDWRALDGAETKKEVITGISQEFDIIQPDVERTNLPTAEEEIITAQDDFMELIKYRQSIIGKQGRLRAAVRDAKLGEREDDEKARHRRHDYGGFARKWLGALAEQEVLAGLVE